MPFEQRKFEICGLEIDQSTLDGMTKFPSFYEPFLRLGKEAEKSLRGKCLGERVDMPDEEYPLTEKIDGSNCQLMGWKDAKGESHMVLRSRTELLAYSRGWLWNDQEGVITTMQPYVPKIEEYMHSKVPDALWMICMEFYGQGIGKRGKDYSKHKDVRMFGSRIFYEPQIKLFQDAPREKHDSLRRVNQHVPFLKWDEVAEIAANCGLKTTPFFGKISGKGIQKPEDAIELLKKHIPSKTAEEDGGSLDSEGLVLWSQADYAHPIEGIVMAAFKVKFEDYPRK